MGLNVLGCWADILGTMEAYQLSLSDIQCVCVRACVRACVRVCVCVCVTCTKVGKTTKQRLVDNDSNNE